MKLICQISLVTCFDSVLFSCSNAQFLTDSVHPEYKRPVWKIPPSDHETVSQITRMESYIATMAWAVGTCASNQQFRTVLKLLKMHMPDVNGSTGKVYV